METIVITASKEKTKKVKAFLDQEKVAYHIKSSTEKSNNKNKSEESPYDPEFVEMVLRARSEKKGDRVLTEDYKKELFESL